jgi:hypothetical protein
MFLRVDKLQVDETVSDTVRSTKVDVEDDRVSTGKTTLDHTDEKSPKRSV